IKNVLAAFNTEHKVVVVATSDGLLVGDVQPLSRLQVTCIAEEGGNRQIGTYGGGGRIGFAFYQEQDRFLRYAREAARQAILNLRAVETPAGVMPFVLGSLNMDDEGTPTSRTVLIERGVLRGYITDRLNARLMGIPLTGNGRRESFQSIPLPRMTNTFMLAGESDPQEIIRSVRRGLYAVSFGGGQVDITNGKFVFSASEAYLIEDGAVPPPVQGGTVI